MDKYIPELWSQLINANLRKTLVGRAIVNTDYAGEIKQKGDVVHILRPTAITTSAYTGADITFQAPASTELLLTIDQARSFGFSILDQTRLQLPNYAQIQAIYAEEASFALNDACDTYILNRAADVPSNNIVDTVKLTKTNITDTIADAAKLLDLRNVPATDRWIVLTPEEASILLKATGFVAQTTSAAGQQIAVQGVTAIGSIYGFMVYVSNNVSTATVSTKQVRNLLFGHRAAITFAEQIVSVEQGRLQNNFGDFVKGLHVYGLKTIKPEALGLLRSEI